MEMCGLIGNGSYTSNEHRLTLDTYCIVINNLTFRGIIPVYRPAWMLNRFHRAGGF